MSNQKKTQINNHRERKNKNVLEDQPGPGCVSARRKACTKGCRKNGIWENVQNGAGARGTVGSQGRVAVHPDTKRAALSPVCLCNSCFLEVLSQILSLTKCKGYLCWPPAGPHPVPSALAWGHSLYTPVNRKPSSFSVRQGLTTAWILKLRAICSCALDCCWINVLLYYFTTLLSRSAWNLHLFRFVGVNIYSDAK